MPEWPWRCDKGAFPENKRGGFRVEPAPGQSEGECDRRGGAGSDYSLGLKVPFRWGSP